MLVVHSISEVWKPPPSLVFKLNFDATIFSDSHRAEFGAIICNDKGEVMAATTAKGPYVRSSDEVELLACRKAIEFAIDVGFAELVIEGDNVNVMNAISAYEADLSLLGNVVDNVRHLLCGLQWVTIYCTRRGGNRVAHALVQYARNIYDDIFWMEDSPPPAMEALYHDSLLL